MSVKKCSYCGKDLPEELQFCPYCMERITEPVKVTVPDDKKKLNKKSIIITIISLVLILLLTVGVALFNHYKNAESNINVNNNGSTENVNATESTNTTESTAENEPLVSVDNDRTQENSTNKNTFDKNDEPQTSNTDSNNTSSTSSTSTTNNTASECEHNWVAITKTVHHDEVGHYETVEKQRKVTKYKCPVCYEKFASLDEYYSHFDSNHKPSYDGDPIKALRNQYTTESGYEYYTTEEWVVDEDAYDETVITGYKCSICGKEK